MNADAAYLGKLAGKDDKFDSLLVNIKTLRQFHVDLKNELQRAQQT